MIPVGTTMNCPYKAYFANLVQQATFTEQQQQLNSSFDKEITMPTNNKRVQRRSTNHHRCHKPVTNTTDSKEDEGGTHVCIGVVVVADPTTSPCQNRLQLVQQGREQQSPVVLVHPNLVVANPPSEWSSTPHHKYGPPRQPIRMASFDSCPTEDHEDEWSSAEEDPIIVEHRLEMEEIFNNKHDPVFESLEPNKLGESAFVSTEHRHSRGVRRSASRTPPPPPSGHNQRGGHLSPRIKFCDSSPSVPRSAWGGECRKASRWGTSASAES